LEIRLDKQIEKEKEAKRSRALRKLEGLFEARHGEDRVLLRKNFLGWASSVKIPFQRISK
jgi:hypothetical protein